MKGKINTLNVAKSFFIFSVITAHSAVPVDILNDSFITNLIRKAWDIISIYGVAGFFIVSGYLYAFEKRSLKDILLRKRKSIVIPWFFCGLLVYIVAQYNPSSTTPMLFIEFLFGYNSYLYYLTMLFAMYFIFYFIKKSNLLISFTITLSILSLLLTQLHIYTPLLTNFLNVFNWVGYFGVGVLIGKMNWLDYFKSKALLWSASIFTILIVTVDIYIGVKTYFNIMSFFTNLVIVCLILCVCNFDRINHNNTLNKIGNYSFSIYLLHMPLVAALKHIIKFIYPDLYILLPFMVTFVFLISVDLVISLIKKYRKLELVKLLIGVR